MSIVEHIKMTLLGLRVLAIVAVVVALWVGAVFLAAWMFNVEFVWAFLGGCAITTLVAIAWLIGMDIKHGNC